MQKPRQPQSPLPEEELRLPRPPGVIRRFWARHPLFADILIAVICLFLSVGPSPALTEPEIPGGWAGISDMQLATRWLTIIAAVVACVLLVWRRRIPVIVFVAAYVLSASYLSLDLPVGGPVVMVASYTLAVYRSARAAWIGMAAGLGALGVLIGVLVLAGPVSAYVGWNDFAGEAVMSLIGTLVGVNVGNRKRYMEAVIDRSRQLLVERDQHAQLAAAAERNRIAREMHDIVSHSLTVIVALSEGAAATGDRERAQGASLAAASTARGALTEMRSMLGVLRQDDPDAPLAPSEPVAPSDTVAAAQRAGYPVSLTLRGSGAGISPQVAYAVGRIVQEGVTNAMRHATRATFIAVTLDYTGDDVVVEVVNDAVSAAPPRGGGFGLRGLRERAEHVGGVFRAGPAGEGKWMLRAELPAAGAQPLESEEDE